MIVDAILAKIFGTKTEREIKAMQPTVQAINDLEPAMRELSDIDLAAKPWTEGNEHFYVRNLWR